MSSINTSYPVVSLTSVIGAVTLILLWALAGFISDREMAAIISSEKKTDPERHYHAEIMSRAPLFWAELSSLAGNRLVDAPGMTVELANFRQAQSTMRLVSWSMVADASGTVTLKFPRGASLSEAALFLTDGSNMGRVISVHSEGTQLIIDSLVNGKWVYVPITANEIKEGRKKIELSAINGNVAISAVAVLTEVNE